jgi:hypothetical protein
MAVSSDCARKDEAGEPVRGRVGNGEIECLSPGISMLGKPLTKTHLVVGTEAPSPNPFSL